MSQDSIQNPAQAVSVEEKRELLKRLLQEAKSKPARFPMSFPQQSLWIQDLMQGPNAIYNMKYALSLDGPLDLRLLERSFEFVAQRQGSLRTSLSQINDALFQVVHPKAKIHCPVIDISAMAHDLVESLVSHLMVEGARRVFRLESMPLFRVALFRYAVDRHALLLVMHHAISDGLSMSIFVSEVIAVYSALANAQEPSLEPLSLTYAEFAKEQQRAFDANEHDLAIHQLTDLFAGAPQLMELPLRRTRPAIQRFTGSREVFTVPAKLLAPFRDLARRSGVSMFMALSSVYATMLSRFCGERDLVIGTPVAARVRPELQSIIGFFANLVAMRFDLSDNPTCGKLFTRTRGFAREVFARQHIPFEVLVNQLKLPRSNAFQPLVQVTFELYNFTVAPLHLPGVAVVQKPLQIPTTKFDLDLAITDQDDHLSGVFIYSSDLFEPEMIQGMIHHFLVLLDSFVNQSSRGVADLDILNEDDRSRILALANGPDQGEKHGSFAHLLSLTQGFARQVALRPEAIAVYQGDCSLTYAALDNASTDLAQVLSAHGCGPESRIAFALERSPQMIVALLAILKTGGAYVPLEITYPKERLRYMRDDAGCRVVLCQRRFLADLPEASLECTYICMDEADAFGSKARLPEIPSSQHEHLAYINYTSGTTGHPKAVQITHGNVLRLVGDRAYVDLAEGSCVGQISNASFDAMTFEVWTALICGGKLCIVDKDTLLDIPRFAATIRAESIKAMFLTVALFNECARQDPGMFQSMDFVLFGGERASAEHVRNVFNAGRPGHLINGYGPTETTTFAVTYDATDLEAIQWQVPIGNPIGETPLYVVDPSLRLVPFGATGELMIAGKGLARGYLNHPALTAERFLPNPFADRTVPGSRMYRSGDLVRWEKPGHLLYMNRIGHQVKIRGFRIELAEIENALATHLGIRDTAVLAHGAGSSHQLVAYVVAQSPISPADEEGFTAELKRHLQKNLPDFMIPSAWLFLEAMPLNTNRKVDRRQLALLPLLDRKKPGSLAGARDALEEVLVGIWSNLLQQDELGIHDNFFEMGGHSLLATQLVFKLREALALNIPVRWVMEAPTIAELAQRIRLSGQESQEALVIPPNLIQVGAEAITPELLTLIDLNQADINHIVGQVAGGVGNIQDIYPLAPLQEGMLFHHQMQEIGDAYLIHWLLSFDTYQRFESFMAALEVVLSRHDILRTSILWHQLPEPVQVVWRSAPIPIETRTFDPSLGPIKDQLVAAYHPRCTRIDLSQAPLVRMVLTQDGPQWLALLLEHHLVMDHTSLEVILEEVGIILNQGPESLPSPVPFRNFVVQALSVSTAEHEAYFTEVLGSVVSPTLPFGLVDVMGDGSRLREVHRKLPSLTSERMRQQTRAWGASPASLCHLVWGLVLSRMCNQIDVVFGTVLFGRMQGGQAERALGLFINTLPFKLTCDSRSTLSALRETQQALLKLLHHEHAPLSLAQRCAGLAVSPQTPLFSSLLNFRHSIEKKNTQVLEGVELLDSEERTNYPFCLSIDDYGDAFALTVQAEAIDPERIYGYFEQALNGVLAALTDAPHTSLSAHPILNEEEQNDLLIHWNNTDRPVPGSRVMFHAFEAQARRKGQQLAVLFENQRLTYAEVNQQANQLAHFLRSKGCGRGSLIAVFLDRSAEMIPALLGILKCGAAYVPIETQLPPARIIQLLQSLDTKVVLTQTQHLAFFQEQRRELPGLDHVVALNGNPGAVEGPAFHGRSELVCYTSENLDLDVDPMDLAYIIFTSGSTGQPKGVIINHEPVTNLIEWVNRSFAVGDEDRVLFVTALSFDLSVYDVFGLLSVGGSIRVATYQDTRDPLLLMGYLYSEAITFWDSAPVALQQVASFLTPDHPGNMSLRLVFLSGDWIPLSLPPLMQACFPNAKVISLGGATEATIWSNFFPVGAIEPEWASVPYGYPIQNATYYALNRSLQPTPKRVAGDLFIGGDVLFRGYWNSRSLTAWKLIPDPFSKKPGARLYRTGDLIRWWEQGYMEFLGRVDHQVKIRGFRVECGEIEAVIITSPEVATAVVRPRDFGANDLRLIAYVVPAQEGTLDVELLREMVKAKLPIYMVPSVFLQLTQMPITANGKLDTNALAAMPIYDKESTVYFEEPESETEIALAQVWSTLLRRERVGRQDNFFDLGGHSLLATRLSSAIRKKFGVEFPLQKVFTASSLASMAEIIQVQKIQSRTLLGPVPVERTGAIPLSFAQQRMMFLYRFEGPSPNYNMPGCYLLTGRLDIQALEDSFNALIQRQDSLRTHFMTEGEETYQVVDAEYNLVVPTIDLRSLGKTAAEAEANRLILQDSRAPFFLERAPLLRVSLFLISDSEYFLYLNIHHIISDGWSMGIFITESFKTYVAFLEGRPSPFTKPKIQYVDYSLWQRNMLEGPLVQEQLDYWVNQLADTPSALELPLKGPRPRIQTHNGARVRFHIPEELVAQLDSVAKDNQATLFMILEAAFSELLGRYSGLGDILIGMPVANRRFSELEPLIGFFVNTLVLRNQLVRSDRVSDRIDRVRQMVVNALSHQDLPFERLVEVLNPIRELNRSPLFQVLFVHQVKKGGQVEAKGITAKAVELSAGTTFDLLLDIEQNPGKLVSFFDYNTDLFSQSLIQDLALHFVRLLEAFVNPLQKIAQIPLLDQDDTQRLLGAWNATDHELPDLCMHQLFEQIVAQHPDRAAVGFRNGEAPELWMTYAELNEQANQMAWLLLEHGVGTDMLIPIYAERGPLFLIGMLATFKAGAGYVPLDPSLPPERLAAVLRSCSADFVLLDESLDLAFGQIQALLEGTHTPRILYLGRAQGHSRRNPEKVSTSLHQAYVIFTSGSTGLPKGAMVNHRGMFNHLTAKIRDLSLVEGDVVAQNAPVSFDISVWQFLSIIMVGGHLRILDRETTRTPSMILNQVSYYRITILELVPSLLQVLLEELGERSYSGLDCLRWLIPTGEALPPQLAQQWLAFFPKVPLLNAYGPTECSDDVSHYRVDVPPGADVVHMPIGSPLQNTQLYVLDRNLELVPPRVPGELYVGGMGVGRGYRGNPGQTAAVFVPDRFSTTAGARLYKTGDLVKQTFIDGVPGPLVFLQRIDFQVKIRGFRIELGEIQAVLLRHERVLDAVVLVDDLGGKRLIAAIREKRISDADETFSGDLGAHLRPFLDLYLPEHMVPSNFILLEEFPLTANGKIDRKRIVQLAREVGYHHDSQPAPVRTVEEQLLQGVWSELLGIESDRIGTDSNFFRSGGHSLMATRLVAKIRSIFKVELPLLEIFSSPSLGEMAAKITLKKGEGGLIQGPVPAKRDQPLPLSFAQQRLWFLYQLEGPSATYNMPMSLRLAGQPVALRNLEQSFQALIQRHESLRTRFVPVGTDCFQQFDVADHFSLLTYDLRQLPRPDAESLAARLIAADLERPFLLEGDCLLRALAIQLGDTELILHFNMHHIVSDGWSMALMTEELVGNYLAFSKGAPSPYQPLKIQYADYAVWQHELFRGPILQEQLAYWTKALADAPVVLDLPTRGPRPAVQTFSGQNHTFHIPESLAQSVKVLARRSDSTPFMILGSVFGELLGRYADTSDVLVGTPIANRRFIELEPLIGFFVNTLVLRYSRHRANTVTDMLRQTRNMVLNAFAYQDVPFEQLVEVLNPVRDLSRSPLFQVMFTLENGNTKPLLTGGMHIEPLYQENKTAKFDLSLSLTEQNGSWIGMLESNQDLFEPRFSERLGAHFLVLLEGVLGQPDGVVASLPMVTLEERQQLVMSWNTTETHFADPEFIISRFESWAKNTPEAPALWLGPETWLSYAALEDASRQWAQRLRQWGCGPETRVGLALGREESLVVALLAVLRNGSAYVPLEPNLPEGRLHFLIEDAGCVLVLTTSRIAAKCHLEDTAKPLVFMDQTNDSTLPTWTKPSSQPQQAVYVLYTSGSTGRPKGVLISHEALTQKLMDLGQRLDLQPGYRHLLMAPMGFDPFAEQLLLPLTHGGVAVLVAHPAELEPQNFWALIQTARCDVIDLVPSMLAFFLDEPPTLPMAHKPTYLLLGGEALNLGLLKRVRALNGFKYIYNYYGPTEATIDALAFLVPETLNEGLVPIGSPMANYTAYVLDSSLQLIPVGVTGGLYLGGSGLARGYLNQPRLTAEYFLPNPFALQQGSRLYRTGDLTRRRDDGNLVFHGREDHQVKLRGVRLELGEIEAALRQLDSVAEAVVLLVGDRLVAFVVPTATDPEPQALTAHLSRMLPPAQVPQVFSFLGSLPMTNNGKYDLQALRDKAAAEDSDRGPLAPPTTEAEKLLASLWSLLLSIPIDQIGRQSNFFAVGGHSLLATRLAASVRKAFSVELPLRDIFLAPTLEALAARISAQKSGEAVIQGPVPINRDQPLPLSFAQQRLWFLYQLEGPSPTYNMPSSLRLEGEAVDFQILTQSFEAMIQRQEVFRTRFIANGEQISQVVVAPGTFVLPQYDLRGLERAEAESQTRALIEADINTPFRLDQDLLLRAFIVQLGDEEVVLHINMHHIVSDGWSMGLLTQEILGNYTAFRNGESSPFQPLAIQYGDYAVWQKNVFSGPVLQEQLSYWTHALAGAPFVLDLPIQKQRPVEQTFNGALEPIQLSLSLSKDLQRLAQRTQTTLFMVLESAFAELMARYSGAYDILIGTPVANRRFSELEPLIGFFVNTLVLRNQLSASESVSARLARVREMALAAFAHQDLPFEQLVAALNPERDLSRSPLFQVMFVLQNNPESQLTHNGLKMTPLESGQVQSKFDLSLSLGETASGLLGAFEYNTDLFERSTIQAMVGHYLQLLAGFASQQESRVALLPILSPAEQQWLLHDLNATTVPLNPPTSLSSAFFLQAQHMPQAIALVHDGRAISYAQLTQQASQIACALQQAGVQPEQRVAILLARRPELLASLIATLAIGAAYVPLDPAYPQDRLAYMLADAGAALLLSAPESLATSGLVPTCPTLFVDTCTSATNAPIPSWPVPIHPAQLAYLIYTSGSTGKPKAVSISHHAATTFLAWATTVYTPADVAGMLAATSVCFDLSIYELFLPAQLGGTIYLVKDILALEDFPDRDAITLVNTVPSAAAALVNQDWLPPKLRVINLAGEPLSANLVDELYKHPTIDRVYDLYGPSEDTTYSTFTLRRPGGPATIGRPIANTRAFILDANAQLVVPGANGELALAGDGLARGYLGQPGQTAARFVPDPYSAVPGGRMYRTGDLAAYLPSGELRLLGRIDHQVKVRGFRIELGEIEQLLEANQHVHQAVVIVGELSGDTRILAFVKTTHPDLQPILQTDLAQKLPGYMVPSAFFLVAELPSLPNGKVDRRALLTLARSETGKNHHLTRPQTPTEQLLVELFASLLGRSTEQVGAESGFFELGGHSLLATRLVAAIRTARQVELAIRDIFAFPTVRELARRIESLALNALPGPRPVTRQQNIPLSFAQQRLWFLYLLEGPTPTYNMPFPLQMNGLLDGSALERAFQNMVQRHEALRTRFVQDEDTTYQVIEPTASFDLAWIDLSGLPAAQAQAESQRLIALDDQRPFLLEQLLLFRTAIIQLQPHNHLLLLNMHHIISDGWSLTVIVRELLASYKHTTTGHHTPQALPELPLQYADYAVWQREQLEGVVLDTQRAFWMSALSGAPAHLPLPTQRLRPPVQDSAGQAFRFHIDSRQTQQVKALARRTGTTPFMVLSTVFAELLSRYAGTHDLVIGTPIANRRFIELEPLIGFFVNTLALRFPLDPSATVAQQLAQSRERILEAFAHQDFPFERLVEVLNPARDLSRSPIFQVMFAMNTNDMGSLDTPGLAIGSLPQRHTNVPCDLMLELNEVDDHLEGTLTYVTDLFETWFIAQIARHFAVLLDGFVQNDQRLVAQLPLVTAEEHADLRLTWDALSQANQAVRDALALPELQQTNPGSDPLTQPHLPSSGYVLDPNLQLLPPGVPGTLFLLAQGFTQAPPDPSTAERYVPNPYATEPDQWLYRTDAYLLRQHDGQLVALERPEPLPLLGQAHHQPALNQPAPTVADRSTNEQALADVWASILNVPSHLLGPTAHFFDLGGHSLLVIRLAGTLRRQLGKVIPIAALIQNPTLAAMARLLDTDGQAPQPVIVPLNALPKGTPWFFVHPVGGQTHWYLPLAQALSQDPVYGIQAPDLSGAEVQGLQTRVTRYVQELLRIQPRGPFRLLGWSAGGTLALAIAEALEKQGLGQVDVVLLDAFRISPADLASEPQEALHFLADLAQGQVAVDPEQVATLCKDCPTANAVWQTLAQAGLLPEGWDTAYLNRLFAVHQSILKAISGYQPQPRLGRTLLVQANNQGRYGWESLQGLVTQTLDADHYSVLQPPHLAKLVDLLKGF